MTKFEIANLIIAVVALVGSIWSAFTTSRNGKRQNELQERLLSLEDERERSRQRASVSARLRASIKNGRLVIANEGCGEARSVEVLVDDHPVLEHPSVLRGAKEITQLGPGAEISYPLALSMGMNPLISVSLSWQDNAGEPGQWSSQLNLF